MNEALAPTTAAFYRLILEKLNASGIPFLVGGAYALGWYTSIERHTKDLDIFVRRDDCPRVLDLFAAAGYRTEVSFPHWLAKVYSGDLFIDIIYSSGNGLAEVTDRWFAHALSVKILGVQARLIPAEELLWTKAFIQERERFDGADVAHLLRAWSPNLDWDRLLENFGPHWRVLLSHLLLFEFIYPRERLPIHEKMIGQLCRRWESEKDNPPPAEPVCQGTLLSRAQYLVDVRRWGYQDARLRPRGNLSLEEMAIWTAAIEGEACEPPRPVEEAQEKPLG
ncbi:MAG: nucleotidyltransferase [Planctomycetes bacterium]|nr:nucleotidyltransferase [Planctomycetota bacterium]